MSVIFTWGDAAVENTQGCSQFDMAGRAGSVKEKLHKQVS